ncbi:HpcH/HpaI aldolase family protein [Capillimicrobium parvum]|uniref:2-dehydro-3,6-dideoxy-6-sulfogluconate aldolase n=1 Tax=Capillimicrobium parvum TaxID=2884022 RepID=A0A9E6Y2A9_9ACTN|nr:aldolase/citrate lyase family protein [Capillimicrobium parvum]UGS38972.1 2-dehydro-3,6-dideoxy-6-sulfogluconate aldolase [Capillimicrobium parvum]
MAIARTGTAPPQFRAALASDQPLFGAWLQLESPLVAEAIGHVGFDWVGIDTQHGMIGYTGMLSMLQALAISGTPSIVRVSTNDQGAIGRALDSGAHGVIVPLIESADAAARAVAACRYPPDGVRSWGPIRPSLADPGVGVRDGDMRAACIVMVETRAGVEHVEEIARVPGVDGILVGPADLGISLGGSPGETLTSEVNDASVREIARACRDAGVAMGSLAPSPQRVDEYVRAGCRFVAAHRDLQSMMTAAVDALTVARGTSTRPSGP